MLTLYNIIDMYTGQFLVAIIARTERGAILKFRRIEQLSWQYPHVVTVEAN